MFCGAGSFKTLDEDTFSAPVSAPGTPKQKKRKSTSKNNPYASRGLDKFSTVLSELESRKEKIIATTGSDDHVLVRFKHTESNDWVPIVVRLPETKEEPVKGKGSDKHHHRRTVSTPTSPRPLPVQVKDEARVKEVKDGDKKKKTKSGFFSWISLNKMKPYSYWPWAIVIVLLSVVFFGKVFAVCCTSIWWYLVPTLNGEDLGILRVHPNKRKILKRRALSDEMVGDKAKSTSPPRVLPSNKKEKPKRLCSF
ncbi:hypothetical protein LUZ61_001615 [Rhynchospora tenuis]|uniref:ZCF37 n=1 Tax=Rhynchospora tenuis TaxID=198213 RepID=A0AAD5ZHC3_9POAL|nr:hypothetical protein LUZ61_001615 [Rhynchospora tenuis]